MFFSLHAFLFCAGMWGWPWGGGVHSWGVESATHHINESWLLMIMLNVGFTLMIHAALVNFTHGNPIIVPESVTCIL
ncbi:hypothetical protein VTL71DRAFT_3456 [Oculimacula yallundae]|uniref:Uncharacterized protein n=1 Tax=Oculimacula yallundae TaxID=86028 RepID=A0ABR4C774_9HELO